MRRNGLAICGLRSLEQGMQRRIWDTFTTFLVSPNPAREGDVAHLQASSVLLVDLLLARRSIEVGHYLRSEHTKRMPSLSPPRSVPSLSGHGALQPLIV